MTSETKLKKTVCSRVIFKDFGSLLTNFEVRQHKVGISPSKKIFLFTSIKAL